MSELLLKSSLRLYRLLKIYLAITSFGVFLTLTYGLLAMYPKVPFYLTLTLIVFYLLKIVFFNYKRILIHAKLSEENRVTTWNPPESAEYLLFVLLPKDVRVRVIGDLNDQYQHITEKNLDKRAVKSFANVWYWGQVSKSIPHLVAWRLGMDDLISLSAGTNISIKDILPFYRNIELRVSITLLRELLLEVKELIVVLAIVAFFIWGTIDLLRHLFS